MTAAAGLPKSEQQPEQVEVQPVGSDGEVLELLAERRAEARVLEVPAVVLDRLGEHEVVLGLLPVRERDAELAPPDLQRETGEDEGGDGHKHPDDHVAANGPCSTRTTGCIGAPTDGRDGASVRSVIVLPRRRRSVRHRARADSSSPPLAGLAASVVFTYLALRDIDFDAFLDALADGEPAWFLAAFAVLRRGVCGPRRFAGGCSSTPAPGRRFERWSERCSSGTSSRASFPSSASARSRAWSSSTARRGRRAPSGSGRSSRSASRTRSRCCSCSSSRSRSRRRSAGFAPQRCSSPSSSPGSSSRSSSSGASAAARSSFLLRPLARLPGFSQARTELAAEDILRGLSGLRNVRLALAAFALTVAVVAGGRALLHARPARRRPRARSRRRDPRRRRDDVLAPAPRAAGVGRDLRGRRARRARAVRSRRGAGALGRRGDPRPDLRAVPGRRPARATRSRGHRPAGSGGSGVGAPDGVRTAGEA